MLFTVISTLARPHKLTSGAHTDGASTATTAAIDRVGFASKEDDRPIAATAPAPAVFRSHSPRVELVSMLLDELMQTSRCCS